MTEKEKKKVFKDLSYIRDLATLGKSANQRVSKGYFDNIVRFITGRLSEKL